MSVLLVVVVCVLILGASPWKWLVLPIWAVFLAVPSCLRWGSAIWRSVGAFREGLRG